jgi:DNA-nicking Smr family endonuclease
MSRGRELTAGERALWRHVTRHVRGARPQPPEPEKAAPETAASPPPKSSSPPKAAPKPVRPSSPAPVADAGAHRRVRRGQVDVSVRIDLHGLTHDQAKAALGDAIERAQAEGARSLLVITGKGERQSASPDFWEPRPGVLRRSLPGWVNDPTMRPHVAGVAEAHARHGGEGAFYILLKAHRTR